MRSREKEKPYRELGFLIETWRSKHFRSALALFKEKKISFSYSNYSDYERGAKLPTLKELLELASLFEGDPSQACLLWAEVQMPTDELKKLFRRAEGAHAEEPSAKKTEAPKKDQPHFENTWVFNPKDAEKLLQTPWLWELCLALGMNYPESVNLKNFTFPKGVTKDSLLKTYLKSWIENGYLELRGDQIQLTNRHLYLPANGPWGEVRTQNLKRAVSDLTQGQSLARELIHRSLTPKQAEKWSKKLDELKEEFKKEDYLTQPGSVDENTYAFVMMLGKRNLKKLKP